MLFMLIYIDFKSWYKLIVKITLLNPKALFILLNIIIKIIHVHEIDTDRNIQVMLVPLLYASIVINVENYSNFICKSSKK